MKEKIKQIEAVRKIITFRFMTDGEIVDLLNLAELVRYSEGEVLIEEGEISPFFFGIIEGTFGVTVKETDGKQVYVNSLGPGDVFGEAGIFMKVRRTATITALDTVLVIRIHRTDLINFIKKHAEAGNKILLVIIFSLLRKLRMVNQELAFERKSDIAQDEIDAMIETLFSEP
ncbi:MAG: cyclic nucleotide-binding domain-containing protein [Spirochaetes bacterium]|nr:cyclic nucleotide-binding domain-containing protein [Spirochaetota bacterium]